MHSHLSISIKTITINYLFRRAIERAKLSCCILFTFSNHVYIYIYIYIYILLLKFIFFPVNRGYLGAGMMSYFIFPLYLSQIFKMNKFHKIKTKLKFNALKRI